MDRGSIVLDLACCDLHLLEWNQAVLYNAGIIMIREILYSVAVSIVFCNSNWAYLVQYKLTCLVLANIDNY